MQLSRLTNRKGDLEKLPQLKGGELGWALDKRKLFIGNGTVADGAPILGNTELLTEFSDILSLSEIENITMDLIHSIEHQSIKNDVEHFIALPKLEEALLEFFEVAIKIERDPNLITSENTEFDSISELGDYGLQLISRVLKSKYLKTWLVCVCVKFHRWLL